MFPLSSKLGPDPLVLAALRELTPTGDSSRARHLLTEAGQLAVTRWHCRALASAWIDAGEPDQARPFIERLARTASIGILFYGLPTFDTGRAEQARQQLVCGLPADARVTVTSEEQRAHETQDWLQCAEVWLELGETAEARRCMREAEELCGEMGSNWLACADGWSHWPEPDEARRCLALVEAHLLFSSDALQSATLWAGLGETTAAQCMRERALELSEISLDSLAVAQVYREVGERAKANAALRHAEGLAQDARDWIYCATEWAEQGATAESMRALDLALEAASYPGELMDVSRLLRELGEPERALSLIQACIGRAVSFSDWMELTMFLDEQGLRDTARTCLERAWEQVEGAVEQLECAGMWGSLDDIETRDACIEQVRLESPDCHEWLTFHGHFASMGLEAAASETLAAGEERAAGLQDWLDCTGAHAARGDRASALRCLERAQDSVETCTDGFRVVEERAALEGIEEAKLGLGRLAALARESSDHKGFAVAYRQLGSGELAADRRRAASLAEDIYGWLLAAEAWNMAGDQLEVDHCLDRATEVAETTANLISIASHELLAGRTTLREACLQRAEAWATSSEDWIDLEHQGLALLVARDGIGSSYLERAEAAAETAAEWEACALAWSGRGQHDRARSCVLRCEADAASTTAWNQCAAIWDELGEEEAQVRRCLARAEALALGAQDLVELAWRWLNRDPSRMRLLLDQAEAVASSADDWNACAQGWQHAVEDGEAAARCETRAQEREGEQG